MKKKKICARFLCALLLTLFTTYVLLDTFVIERTYAEAAVQAEADKTYAEAAVQAEADSSYADMMEQSETIADTENDTFADSATDTEEVQSEVTETSLPLITESSYEDENIQINIQEYTVYDTKVYVADVRVSSAEYLKTAFADDIYGKNVTEKTSDIAESSNAILAVNGDFYGSRDSGYVVRNGIAYRDTAKQGQEDLVIGSDGDFSIIREDETSLEEIVQNGAWQVLSFGPAIVENGEIAVSEGEEVGKAKSSNPRTAIGMINDLHYVFVVSDGRTSESAGLSLSQLAEVMQSLGCSTAYNLDGGGSSTMYFNGQVVNNPTTNGNSIKERSVSDIVYIG